MFPPKEQHEIAWYSETFLAYSALFCACSGRKRQAQEVFVAESAKTELTPVDRKILRALQQDGRMTVQAIADQVGLSASPCLRRIRQMEKAGIISAYCATVDQKAVGLPVSVFISIKLERQRASQLDQRQNPFIVAIPIKRWLLV